MAVSSPEFRQIFTIIIIASIAAAVQLLLCKKAKSISAKLVPVLGSAAFTVFFYVLAISAGGWDGFFILSYAFISFIV